MKAGSFDEFFNDRGVTDTDLRDLALKIDYPGLKDIRDACADFGREGHVYEEYEEPEEEIEDKKNG